MMGSCQLLVDGLQEAEACPLNPSLMQHSSIGCGCGEDFQGVVVLVSEAFQGVAFP